MIKKRVNCDWSCPPLSLMHPCIGQISRSQARDMSLWHSDAACVHGFCRSSTPKGCQVAPCSHSRIHSTNTYPYTS